MSEIIGTFSLEHVSNTYTVDENNAITNHTNWKGSAEVTCDWKDMRCSAENIKSIDNAAAGPGSAGRQVCK